MWIGLGIITAVAIINGSTYLNLVLFPLYGITMLAGLQLRDKQGYKQFTVLVVVELIGVIVMSFLRPNIGNGGFIDPANYNIATGLTLVGFLISYDKYKWIVLPAVVLGIFLTSGEEAVILLIVLAAAILIKRDWSKKILPTLLAGVICLVLFFGFHQPSYLYMVSSNQWAVLTGNEMLYQTDLVPDMSRGRMEGYKLAVTTPTILGHGFDAKWDTHDTVHNVPLRVFYDLGIIGLIGFMLTLAVWARKTGYYVIVLILTIMMFDHYFWTQIGVWLWLLFGMTYNVSGRYIFRSNE